MRLIAILSLVDKNFPLSQEEFDTLREAIEETGKHLERLQDAHKKVTGRKHKWFK